MVDIEFELHGGGEIRGLLKADSFALLDNDTIIIGCLE